MILLQIKQTPKHGKRKDLRFKKGTNQPNESLQLEGEKK
jgi:hypothetical protein